MAPYDPKDVLTIDWTASGQEVLGPPGTKTHVELPQPIREAFPSLASWELRDSNWSPDFPTSARNAESFLRAETGKQVDGVIAIDPYFVASLLAIVGPTKVPETGDIVDANNFFATALNRIELKLTATRKNFLGQAGRAILPKVLALRASGPLFCKRLPPAVTTARFRPTSTIRRSNKLLSRPSALGPWNLYEGTG
jgi:hypothetical protein